MPEYDIASYIVDWRNGRFQRETDGSDIGAEDAVTIVIAGDWGPGPEQEAALRADSQSFYGNVASVFEDADLSAVNLEMPISSAGTPIVKDGPSLPLGPEVVTAGLDSIGCSIACLANNHIMDYGVGGLTETLNVLQDANIHPIGAGWDEDEAGQPFIADVDGHRIAFLNVAEGEESKASAESPGAMPLTPSRLCTQIRELRPSSDAVIVIVHAGREFVPIPPPYIRATYRALADAGASIVIGHHPHVPQGIELWNGVPIVYSLGHFVFWVNPMTWPRSIGYLLSLEITATGIAAFEVKPFEIGQTGLVLLDGARRTSFLAELEGISRHIASPFLEEFWDAYADLWEQSRLPEELVSFSMLMSWQDWVRAIRHRIWMDTHKATWPRRLAGRVSRRALSFIESRIPSQRKADPQLATMLRNRFDTLAHLELYRTALGRAATGKIGESPSWTRELLEAWEVDEWRAWH